MEITLYLNSEVEVLAGIKLNRYRKNQEKRVPKTNKTNKRSKSLNLTYQLTNSNGRADTEEEFRTF